MFKRRLLELQSWKASGNRLRGQRQEEQPFSPAPKATAQTDEAVPSRSSGHRGQSPSGTSRGRFPCRDFLKGKCTNASRGCWHPPVCLNYKSETGCAFGKKCRFRHVEIDGQPNKKSEKSGFKGSVALLMETVQLGCVSHDSSPRKSILRKEGQLGSKHAVKFSRGTWHHKTNRERKGPSRGAIQKREPHERNPCSPTFS